LRDFVVLDAIDLERNQTPIEINCDANFRDEFPFKNNIKRIGINIGCGTPGAESKRMSTTELAEYVTELNKFCDFEIFLTGADYEHEINEAFIEKLHASQKNITVYNLAGKTDIKKLLYLINSCDLFITTDSGPYHISVALMRPTLCWLTYNAIGSIHNHLWVRCLIAPNQSTFVKNSLELIFKKNSF
jgi:ADP-heptose:LPS heptosyltransferase